MIEGSATAAGGTSQPSNATTVTEKIAATVKSVVDKVLVLLQDRRVLLVAIAAAAAVLLLLLVCCITCCLRRSRKKRTQVATTKATEVGVGDTEDAKDAARKDQRKGLLAYAGTPEQSALDSIAVVNRAAEPLYPNVSAAVAAPGNASLLIFTTEEDTPASLATGSMSRTASGTNAGVVVGLAAGNYDSAPRAPSATSSTAGTPYGSKPPSRRGSKPGLGQNISSDRTYLEAGPGAEHIGPGYGATPPETNRSGHGNGPSHLDLLNVAGRFQPDLTLDEEEEDVEVQPRGLRRLFGGGKNKKNKKKDKREVPMGGVELMVPPTPRRKRDDRNTPRGSLSVTVNAGNLSLAELQKLPRISVVVVNDIEKTEETRGNSRLDYVFEGLRPGLKTVGVWFRGQEIARGQVTVLKDQLSEITLDVSIKPSILRVATSEGEPVPDVTVRIFATHPRTFVRRKVGEGQTDKDGDLCLALPEGLGPADYFFAEIRGPSNVLLARHKDIRLLGSSCPTLLAP